MQADLKSVLGGVLENVLEQYAFMFCEPSEPEHMPEPDGSLLQVTMTFSGASRGALCVAVPQALAAELATNALGIDEEEQPEGAADDALRELLNIICGQTLTAVAGEEPVFDLSIPAVAPCDHETWKALATGEKTIPFVIEGYPFLLRAEISV